MNHARCEKLTRINRDFIIFLNILCCLLLYIILFSQQQNELVNTILPIYYKHRIHLNYNIMFYLLYYDGLCRSSNNKDTFSYLHKLFMARYIFLAVSRNGYRIQDKNECAQ